MILIKGKFYRMYNGLRVECLSTTAAGNHPAVLQDESGQIYYTKLNGQHVNCNLSVVGEWREKRTVEAWANVYSNGTVLLHTTQMSAENAAGGDRVACVKLTGEYET